MPLLFSGMNDDLLIEILARLPLKAIFRFKCVSKSWYRLISDDHLRRRLTLITSTVFFPALSEEPRYACTPPSSSATAVLGDCDLTFFPHHRASTIVDSCNGLVLCRSNLISSTFHVINPVTKRWRTLPKPRRRSLRSVLGFDPRSSPEFRVVSFAGWLSDGVELEVFRSETGNWTEHELNLEGLSPDALSTTMCFSADTLYVIAYPNQVVEIELAGATCGRLELPEPAEHEASIGSGSGGFLHYAHRDEDQIKIWALSGSSNWVLRGVIGVHSLAEKSIRSSGGSTESAPLLQLRFLAFHPDRDVVYFWVPGKIVSYDVSRKAVAEAYKFDDELARAYFFRIWLFPFSRHMSDCLASK